MSSIKELIGTISFKTKHNIEISAYVEFDNNYPEDIIFFSFFENMNRSDPLSMKLTINDVLIMVETIRANIKGSQNGKPDFEVFKKETKNPSSGKFSNLYITAATIEKKDQSLIQYYINISKDTKKGAITMSSNGIMVFCQRVERLMVLLENGLYQAQKNIYNKKAKEKAHIEPYEEGEKDE
ncbi:hypothetical protein [Aquamicrobium sp.]|uniref:hypothetical protein n=1 Tax=Aquamicrobium sp. TaxID=1872579 RepID=UPI00258E5230|nr:hypothetical protein [Aquamicrobium sp.]MCK9549292.1 hypothetical protein [Aquamicrobium sp.]